MRKKAREFLRTPYGRNVRKELQDVVDAFKEELRIEDIPLDGIRIPKFREPDFDQD